MKPRWEFATQIVKDIYVQTLRQFLPSMIDAEVKEFMKKNEDKMTLRFNNCLILIKDIEHVVKSATKTWKNFYNFHNPSDFPVDIKDEKEEGKDEEENEGSTHYVTIVYEEYKDQLAKEKEEEEEQEAKATKEDKQDDEETKPMKIVAIVIASLPHSPIKLAAISNSKTTSASLIMTTIDTSNVQSLFAPTQLNVSLSKVTSTSSIELQPLSSLAIKLMSSVMNTVSSTVFTCSTLSSSALSSSMVSTPILSTSVLGSTIFTL